MSDDATDDGRPDAAGSDDASPRLPSSIGSNPAMVLPPARDEVPDSPVGLADVGGRFMPLRADPPPTLLPTWVLRYALFSLLLMAMVITLWAEYAGEAGDVVSSMPVLVVHAGAAGCLVAWSMVAMYNAQALVPATRYQHRSRASFAGVLWMLAFGAPFGVVAAHRALRDRLAEPGDAAAVALFAGSVLIAFILLWLPFRYLARQAARIGAPHSAAIVWFWAPLFTLVGSLGIIALGLRDMVAEDGLEDAERLLVVAIAYGLPMFVFALSSWRAVTVFDEVLDIRWRRWKTEWEQTIADFARQPAPGPEDSPTLPRGSR